jgi:hypothetical protein
MSSATMVKRVIDPMGHGCDTGIAYWQLSKFNAEKEGRSSSTHAELVSQNIF